MSDSTYLDTLKRIDALKKEAEDHKAKEIGPVIDRFKKAIAVYGILPQDVFTAEQLSSVAGSSSAKAHSGARPPKYVSKDGKTWSGFGRKPQWFIDATARGQSAESFLIKSTSQPAVASAPAATPTPTPAPKPAATTPAAKTRASGAKLMNEERTRRQTQAAAPAAKPPKGAVKKAGKGSIAYRLGDNSWTGTGPRPRWFKDALAQGRTLDDLRA